MTWFRYKMVGFAAFAVAFGQVLSVQAAEPTVTAKDLPRIKATEPADAVKTFQVRPGFHIELAASEPLVIDPIAMSFDADGRMYVIEMRDYSERRAEHLSRIRCLEDTDGDGVYDKATLFLDNLPWATAITCVNGGVLVGACPDIIFAKDTNGDGVADEKKIVFTGFGSTQEKLNVQGLFNNFIWGPDNRIHGCSGHDGGMVQQSLHPDRAPLDVRGKGFVIDPRDWSMTTEAGGGQYGLSFDPWGRLYTCENSSHIEMFMYDAAYASRNPYYTMPNPMVSIAADGPAAEVFRISPEEPWRVIRTRWRVAGLVGGPVEGGGRSAGYFTGATGATIYKGDAFGKDYVGDAFVGDAGGNLVHHKRIHADGVGFIAERPADEKKREFAASNDTWFRPVDFANAPDGTLYIADMYREIIEHPWSIPPQIKQFLDLNSGNDRGRIYRLAPDGFHHSSPPKLNQANSTELVQLLAHPNAWQRETANRLLFERQDKSVLPALRDLLRNSPSPLARLGAMNVLEGMNSLKESDLLAGFADADANVRERAVKLAESQLHSTILPASLWTPMSKLAGDPADRVRYQLAFTLGQLSNDGRETLLSQIAHHDAGDPWIRSAILSSLKSGADTVFDNLFADESFRGSAVGRSMLMDLAQIIGAAGPKDSINQTLSLLNRSPDLSLKLGCARGIFEGAAQSNTLATLKSDLLPMIQSARNIAGDTKQPSSTRVNAVELLGFGQFEDVGDSLLTLIGTRQDSAVAIAAFSAIDRFDNPAIADGVIQRWSKFSRHEQPEAIGLLVKRPARALALLHAIQVKQIPPDAIPAQQAAYLQHNANNEVARLAREILPTPGAKREAVVEQFKSALALTGDRAKGKSIYEQRCIACHRLEGEGNAVGPDLVTVKNSGKEKLLLSILDPSREVAPNYVSYLIETQDGQSLVGIIANDTTTSITLKQAYGKDTTFPRSNIKRMSSDRKSLMPDGLEVGLTPQNMADLLEFISTARP